MYSFNDKNIWLYDSNISLNFILRISNINFFFRKISLISVFFFGFSVAYFVDKKKTVAYLKQTLF